MGPNVMGGVSWEPHMTEDVMIDAVRATKVSATREVNHNLPLRGVSWTQSWSLRETMLGHLRVMGQTLVTHF